MLFIYRWLRGFLKVLFYGDSSERILNICSKNGIFLWNSRLSGKDIETCIFIKDFLGLRKLLRGSGIRVKILKKTGLPFLVNKNKKRIGIAVGLALSLLFLQFMSGYIWIIEVDGNKKISSDKIIESCEKIGIYEGKKSSDISPKKARERFLLNTDSFAWASFNIESSKLTVNVSEAKEDTANSKAPANLKAKADGIIEKIDITSGNCLVKKGDTVKKGDILVSGIVENAEGTKFVRSSGAVFAETKRYFEIAEDYKKEYETETGKVKNKKALSVFGIKIPLFLGSEKGDYKSTLKVTHLKLFGQKLPVKIYERQFVYTKKVTYVRDSEKLKEELSAKLDERIKKLKITEYSVETKEYSVTETGITLKEIINAKENIAVSEDILVSE